MLIGAMAYQDRAMNPAGPAADHHHPALRGHRTRMLQLCHVMARMGALLNMGDMGMVNRVRRARRGRFRNRSRCQTKAQKEIRNTLKQLLLHLVCPLETPAMNK